MPTAIDHASFPHIFDTILANGPYASLVQLRQAARWVRDIVDLRLCFSGRTKASSGPYQVMKDSSEGRLLGKEWYRNPELAGAVRTADLFPSNTYVYSEVFIDAIKKHMTNVGIIRQREYPPTGAYYFFNMTAPVVIVFVDLFPKTEADWFRTSHFLLYEQSQRGAETVIYNVRYEAAHGYAATMDLVYLQCWKSVKHVVFLFSPVSEDPSRKSVPRPAASAGSNKPRYIASDQLLSSLAIPIGVCMVHNPVRFTFVGIERLPNDWIEHPYWVEDPSLVAELESAPPGDIATMFRVMIKYIMFYKQPQFSRGDDSNADISERLRFLSSAEWCEEVGERMHDLATIP